MTAAARPVQAAPGAQRFTPHHQSRTATHPAAQTGTATMVTTSTRNAPKLVTVRLESDGVVHTRQVDAATLVTYDEQGVDYTRVAAPMTGMEHLPDLTGSAGAAAAELEQLRAENAALKAAQPANKAGAPANK